jgi:hypothetical protein
LKLSLSACKNTQTARLSVLMPRAASKTYREGYGTAAAFLNWVAETCDVRLIERLNVSLQSDAYNGGLFREITGRTLDQLWAGYQEKQLAGLEACLHVS